MITDSYKKHGTPNWVDCATTDLQVAERFYAAMFGWVAEHVTTSDGAVYSIQRLDGKMVAGIYELSSKLRTIGVPPHWGTYFHVDDVAATLKRVAGAGGTVHEGPFDEPDVGTFGVLQDTVGAYLGIWHSTPQHGGELFNVPGAMTWNELCTKEPIEAAAFYKKVLGLEPATTEAAPGYTLLQVDGRPVAGVLKSTPEMGDHPASWDVYFATDDVEATLNKAITAGGKALREPFDIPGARMAVLQDPLGAVFEVIKTHEPDS